LHGYVLRKFDSRLPYVLLKNKLTSQPNVGRPNLDENFFP